MPFIASLVLAAGLVAGGDELAAARRTFRAEILGQCPDKQLDRIAPAVLQHELLRFPLSEAARRRREDGWKAICDPASFDSSCGNGVALEALNSDGRLKTFVGELCSRWSRCPEQSYCVPSPAREAR